MSLPLVCGKCGFTNQPGFQFCTNCGNPLVPGPGPTVAGAPSAPTYGGAPAPPGYVPPYVAYPGAAPGYWAAAWEFERKKQIDRTRTGLLLLLVGTALGWVPYIGFVGGILALIGAIMVILGRKAFGAAHGRNVVISIVLYLVGFVGVIALGAMIAFVTFGSPTTAALVAAYQSFLLGTFVVAAVAGIASVLFTYALQQPMGKVLLWIGYGASIAVGALLVYVMDQELARAVASGSFDAAAFTALVESYSLLDAIPSIIFGIAYYLAWSRVNRGEIPPPATPVPATTPPMPPAV